MKYFFLLILGLLTISSSCKKMPDDSEVTTIYLVRHAEKTKQSNDPGLTKEGKERAYYLADYLKNIPLDAIYSTDYFRTRKTAQPTASAQNVEMQLYDASDLSAFAEQIKSKHKNQKVLIVGHSNTTAELSNFLIGESRFKSIPETDYDNIYIVTLGKKSKALNLKYGTEIGKLNVKGKKKDMVK